MKKINTKEKINQAIKSVENEPLTLRNLFWIFFFGSIVGVMVEIVWCIFKNGNYQSRTSLVYGQFNLVYGIGAVLISMALSKVKDKKNIKIFFTGTIIGALFEYVCSVFQELCFGTISWDYSKFIFNINGRINLLYSFFFGLLAIVWIKKLYPLIIVALNNMKLKHEKAIIIFIIVFLIINITISWAATKRRTERHSGIEARNKLEQIIDDRFDDERMQKIYPNMIYVEK